MSKKILIAIAAIVILAVGGYFCLRWHERTIEKNILAELALVPPHLALHCDSVAYSFFSGEIAFTNLTARIESAGTTINVAYKIALIRDPNLAAFQGTAKPGMTLIAKKILFEGATVAAEDGSFHYTIKNGHADNIRMDIHAIREICAGGGSLSALLSKALEVEYTHMEYTDLAARMEAEMPGGQMIALSFSARRMTSDNAAKHRIGAARAEGIAYDLPEGISLKIADINVKNLFVPDFNPLLNLPEHQMPEAFLKLFTDERLLEDFTMNGFAFTRQGRPIMGIARYNAQSAYEPVYTHKQSIESLSIDREALRRINPDWAEVLEWMGYEELTGNLSATLRWSEKERLFSVEPFVADVKDAGRLAITQRMFVPKGMTAVMDALMDDNMPLLNDVNLNFEDKSLTTRLFTAIAEEAGLPVEEILLEALFQIDFLRENAYDSYDDEQAEQQVAMADALETFLLNPGSLVFSMTPERPTPLNALFMALIFAPESLNIQITSTPGEKPLIPDFAAPPRYRPEPDEPDTPNRAAPAPFVR